jgi:hypothetical protein
MKISEDIFAWYLSNIIQNINLEVNKYWKNAPIIFSIIYEEQSHLNPPIIEDQLWGNSIWLWQIRTPVPESDKEYFWYKFYTKEQLLDSNLHIKVMNDRIDIIKAKLQEEGKTVTPERIWRAWNGWPSCVKALSTCDNKALNYWERIKKYYDFFEKYNNIITEYLWNSL